MSAEVGVLRLQMLLTDSSGLWDNQGHCSGYCLRGVGVVRGWESGFYQERML